MRLTRPQMFMEIAEVVSRRSTCYRRNVGAVLTRNHRIISTGYNGAPAGQPHCDGVSCFDLEEGCTRAIHAELNACLRAESPNFQGCTMYCTESPCVKCARMMVKEGFESVYFMHQYRITTGCDILRAAGVSLFRITPAGHIIDWERNELLEGP